MIAIRRVSAPKSLAGPKSAGGLETQEAIRIGRKLLEQSLVAAKARPKAGAQTKKKKAAKKDADGIKFKAYKSDDVVAALRAMFRKKCAYCEFNYAAGGPEDVEHFRPKGAVYDEDDGELVTPGYYWLAAEWTNLLPSCIDCNRKRTKSLAGAGKGVSGKANLFPVADKAKRWRDDRQKNQEEHLLLNPCEDMPEEHIEFIPGGLVRPTAKGGIPSARGEHSIRVFGLHREDLVEQRAMKEKLVRAALESALQVVEMARRETDAQRRKVLDGLATTLLGQAKMHVAETEPFLAVTRTIFREYNLSLP